MNNRRAEAPHVHVRPITRLLDEDVHPIAIDLAESLASNGHAVLRRIEAANAKALKDTRSDLSSNRSGTAVRRSKTYSLGGT